VQYTALVGDVTCSGSSAYHRQNQVKAIVRNCAWEVRFQADNRLLWKGLENLKVKNILLKCWVLKLHSN